MTEVRASAPPTGATIFDYFILDMTAALQQSKRRFKRQVPRHKKITVRHKKITVRHVQEPSTVPGPVAPAWGMPLCLPDMGREAEPVDGVL